MKTSAGILVYRYKNNQLEILLVHPGGPFWRKKDKDSWSIPKGESQENEELFSVALREFKEETGLDLSEEDKKRIFYLGTVKNLRKIVHLYALEKDFGDNLKLKSIPSEIEWPLKSGKKITFPETDKIGYFNSKQARIKLVKYQKSVLDLLKKFLKNKNIKNHE